MTDPTLPPPDAEYTHAFLVPGHGPTAGLYAIELIGHAHWRSGFAWSDPVMAQRAGNRLLARSQAGVGA